MFTSKNFWFGVAAGIAAIIVIKKLPASIPGVTAVQSVVAKVI